MCMFMFALTTYHVLFVVGVDLSCYCRTAAQHFEAIGFKTTIKRSLKKENKGKRNNLYDTCSEFWTLTAAEEFVKSSKMANDGDQPFFAFSYYGFKKICRLESEKFEALVRFFYSFLVLKTPTKTGVHLCVFTPPCDEKWFYMRRFLPTIVVAFSVRVVETSAKKTRYQRTDVNFQAQFLSSYVQQCLVSAIIIKPSRIACRCDHNNRQIYGGFPKVEGDYELPNFAR
uniref:Uncharacterized protein n=1 Tax=Glossina palpalis gambiensis TaxID=67801 RepID=A0A1B0ATV4_9MUSC